MIKRLIVPLSFFILLVAQQKTGSISGMVSERGANNSLPGVNIILKGTYYGTASDGNGDYIIDKIRPGIYDVEISMIGYKVLLQTGIHVNSGETTHLNFRLEKTVLSYGEEVLVIGNKPLFDVDETASVSRISSDEIENRLASGVEDLLAKQIGITKHDNEIHIRGGRIDESLFIVDGMSVKDPLSGYSGNLYINAESIEELEVITGGYNAEYGQAMSGIINVNLKSGSDKYEGAVKYISDHWGVISKESAVSYSDRLEFNLGGPELVFTRILPLFGIHSFGKFSFYLSGFGNVFNSHLPVAKELYPHRNWDLTVLDDFEGNSLLKKLATRGNNDWHLMYKLVWELTPQKKLTVSYDGSLNINQGFFMPRAFSSTYFPYRYQNILDNYNTITRESRLVNINWTHSLGMQSFYTLTLGRFITMEHSAVQDLNWSDYRERLDLEPINYILTDEDGNVRITYGDEFYDSGFAPEWYDMYSDNLRLDLDWTHHLQSGHKLKAGVENTWTEMQVLDIDEPWTGTTGLGANYDSYKARTTFGAFYLQDQIIFEGMTINLGMRYDYWFPGKYVENAINNTNAVIITDEARDKFNQETFSLFGAKGKGRLSPRFGISHPVTDNDVLYFYYGHFSQLPTFQYVYAKLNSTSQSTYQIFGNPNLNSKTTVQYELGIKHRFNPDQVLEVKAFWKDMFDYETSQSVIPSNPKYSHLSFNMYFNADYARARGIEAIIKSRLYKNWYVDLNANYSIVTGKSSTPYDNLLVDAGELREKPLDENFIVWDRPFQFFTNVYYQHPSGWGSSLRVEFSSGRRYTRSIPGTNDYPEGIIYVDEIPYYVGTREDDKPYYYLSEYYPNFLKLFGINTVSGSSTVDLKVYKSIKIRNITYKLFFETENLLNESIPRRINPFTGQGYNPGEIIPYYLIENPNPNEDPSRNGTPRKIVFGIQLLF
ncbi:MAG: TonB-dependent receptor [Candidatus Marinimicrobia bacterium]|jgi:hypothetical protein|nr:TonB-dependent receptor [Candidatus Neomarinimicrobiota bacterium]